MDRGASRRRRYRRRGGHRRRTPSLSPIEIGTVPAH
jgi:hypothetical protein